MSTKRSGPPKHQNKFAWVPRANVKVNETEVGGRFRPLSEITGVCPRCKNQIDWKRNYYKLRHNNHNSSTKSEENEVYGKYKALVEPSKCQKCGKRAVRQAYHNLCTGCAKEHNICAKCCCSVEKIVGRDVAEVAAERKALDDAIKNARERERRSLLRAMNPKKKNEEETPKVCDRSREGDIFRATTIDEHAEHTKKKYAQAKQNEGKEEDKDQLIDFKTKLIIQSDEEEEDEEISESGDEECNEDFDCK